MTTLTRGDRLVLGTLQATLQDARDAGDQRPALELLARSLAAQQAQAIASERAARMLIGEQDAWLCQLQDAWRAHSTICAHRVAIDDMLAWAQRERRAGELFEQQTIVDYLAGYQQRCQPAPATLRRRFMLLRAFMQWVSRRQATTDPFRELPLPPDPRRRERNWLTREELAQLLAGAARPRRALPGLAERDTLVLLTLVLTGISPREMIPVRWRDISLDEPYPSLQVCSGRRATHRHIPLPSQLATELHYWRARHWRQRREPMPTDRVFLGLHGGRLSAAMIEQIITRATRRAGLEKHVNTHTLPYSVIEWLKRAGGEDWLITEYRGGKSVSYPSVVAADLRRATQQLADHLIDNRPLAIEPARWRESTW